MNIEPSRHFSDMMFSTWDKENDKDPTKNCAIALRSGWWYNACSNAHLNGPYWSKGNKCATFNHQSFYTLENSPKKHTYFCTALPSTNEGYTVLSRDILYAFTLPPMTISRMVSTLLLLFISPSLFKTHSRNFGSYFSI